jgi:hypothetical protein
MYSGCHLSAEVDLTEPIMPGTILSHVALPILYETPDLFARVVARHFVVRVSKEAFYRIGSRAVGGQKHQLDTRMCG